MTVGNQSITQSGRSFGLFLCIGGAGSGIYIVLATLLTNTGLPAWIASVICYSLLVPVIYLAQRSVVFHSKAAHTRSFPKYQATQLAGVMLAGLIPYIANPRESFDATLLFIFAAAAIAVANFIIHRHWTFS